MLGPGRYYPKPFKSDTNPANAFKSKNERISNKKFKLPCPGTYEINRNMIQKKDYNAKGET